MMKKLMYIISGILFSYSVNAQDFEDALRYSETFQQGNARSTSMAGAYGALGANLSGLSVNPAGSALLQSNVFEFSPAFTMIKSQNYFLGNYDRAFASTMKLPNMGIAFSKEVSNNDLNVNSISFGFVVNRQNQFNENIVYNAVNNSNSLTDEFLRLSYQTGNLNADLANAAYLIGDDNGTYYTDYRWIENNALITDYGQDQNVEIQKCGQKKEYLFNFGVNFNDKLFVGADVNIQSLYYTHDLQITETDNAMTKDYLESFTYATSLEASGVGANAKLGVIIKPTDFIRFGLAAHSPSSYSINENFSTSIQSYFNQPIQNVTNQYVDSEGEFDYYLETPGKYVASLGLVLKNIAVLGIDYESIDYSYSYFSAKESMSSNNATIKNNLTKADNLKIGAEVKYGPLSFRGGYAVYGNPYKKLLEQDPYYKTDISGGIGLSNDDFYCDMSVVNSMRKQTNLLYSDIDNKPVTAISKVYTNNILFTVGFKF